MLFYCIAPFSWKLWPADTICWLCLLLLIKQHSHQCLSKCRFHLVLTVYVRYRQASHPQATPNWQRFPHLPRHNRDNSSFNKLDKWTANLNLSLISILTLPTITTTEMRQHCYKHRNVKSMKVDFLHERLHFLWGVLLLCWHLVKLFVKEDLCLNKTNNNGMIIMKIPSFLMKNL